MRLSRIVRCAFIALAASLVVVLDGCAIGPEVRKEIQNVNDVSKNEVIIVGRIELVPPLEKDELRIEVGGPDVMGWEEMIRDHAFLEFNAVPERKDEYDKIWANPKLRETYVLSISKDTPYLVGGRVYLQRWFRSTGRVVGVGGHVEPEIEMVERKVVFPIRYRLDVKPDDRAIYIGTLRFHRDEFGSVTKVELLDEYDQALQGYRARFGNGPHLRKAIPTPLEG